MTQEEKSVKQDQQTKIYSELLLEQYKLYVEMTDRVSKRRIEASKLYISLLTGLLGLLSIVVSIPTEFQKHVVVVISILGMLLCLVWIINIRSYRELNSLKFKVIHEMEQKLPFPCYEREWEILQQESDKRSYLRLTRIEQYIPLVLLIPYIILFVYIIVN
jgi:hypothetical protein